MEIYFQFRVVKLAVPDDEIISKIPSSCGHLPIVSKVFTGGSMISKSDMLTANADAMTASQRPVSNSFFITSNLAAGLDDKKEVLGD